MKKLLLLIACASVGSTHGMLVRNMILTELSEKFNNNFSGLTLKKRKECLKEAILLKKGYDRLASYHIKPFIVLHNTTTVDYSPLIQTGMFNFHKNPSAQLKRIVHRLVNQIKQENFKAKKIQSNRRSRRLIFQAKQAKQLPQNN
jgi:hypothetical protein